MQLYHLSESSKPLILEARIPNNFFTKNDFEDNTTKRICFSTSIDGALAALSQNLENKILYIHEPVYSSELNIKNNSFVASRVPDAKLTGEVWVLNEKIGTKITGKIKVLNAKEPPKKFTYGKKNNEYIAELYFWNYKNLNINKINYEEKDLTKDIVDKYKNKYKNLKHIRFNNNTKGKYLIENDNLIGIVQVDTKRNYILALEVFDFYKRKGYGTILLNIAENELHANKLSVNKKNKNAILLYKKNGWIIYNEDNNMLYMKKENSKMDIKKELAKINYDSFSSKIVDKAYSIMKENNIRCLNKDDLAFELENFFYEETAYPTIVLGDNINESSLVNNGFEKQNIYINNELFNYYSLKEDPNILIMDNPITNKTIIQYSNNFSYLKEDINHSVNKSVNNELLLESLEKLDTFCGVEGNILNESSSILLGSRKNEEVIYDNPVLNMYGFKYLNENYNMISDEMISEDIILSEESVDGNKQLVLGILNEYTEEIENIKLVGFKKDYNKHYSLVIK